MLLGLNARPVKRLSGFLADGNLGGLAALAADVDAGSKVVIVDAYTVDIVVLDGGIAIVVYHYIRDAGRCRAAEDAEVVKHHGIALGAGESDGDIYVFEKEAYVFITPELVDYIKINLTKVGSVGVVIKEVELESPVLVTTLALVPLTVKLKVLS